MHKTEVDLGNEFYNLVDIKLKTRTQASIIEVDKLKRRYENLTSELDALKKNHFNLSDDDKDYKEDKNRIDTALLELRSQVEQEELNIAHVDRLLNKFKSMKDGSVALTGQITNVSKVRIVDPENSRDSLYGIRLSNESVKKILDFLNKRLEQK